MRGQVLDLASDLFEVSADDLDLVGGEIVSRDGALRKPLGEVTGKLGRAQLVGTGSRGPNPEGMRVNTFGCQIAQVAVDPATGEIEVERIVAVHDIGRVLNPLTASSQVEGGILQGLGFALMEERVVDPTTGTVVNGGLEDYKLLTIADCPEIISELLNEPGPAPVDDGREGPRRAAHHPDGRSGRERGRRGPRHACPGGADHAQASTRVAALTGYTRPAGLAEAIDLLAAGDALALAGGSDVVPLVRRGKRDPATLVDVRRLLPAGIEPDGAGLRIGAGTTLATLAADERVADGYAALHQAASAAASPQLRNVGTVGGNLAQAVRCWYFRHPDLTCWLNGGDTCYAQIGDHRKHGLEAGDCISVAPSDLAAPLGALGARVALRGPGGEREVELLDLYGRPAEARRSAVQLEPGELIVSLQLPAPPDASRYERAGERAAWSFALVGVAAARRGGDRRLVAIGVTNEPRALDPSDPLRGLDGLEQTGWKRRLLAALCERALGAIA